MLKWADYWPYWEFILTFFSMWPFLVMCRTMGYLFHVWGGVGVGLVMFWEGNWNNLQLNNCFWNIWVALKRAWQVKDPP